MAIVQVRPRQTGEFKSVPVGWGKVNAKARFGVESSREFDRLRLHATCGHAPAMKKRNILASARAVLYSLDDEHPGTERTVGLDRV